MKHLYVINIGLAMSLVAGINPAAFAQDTNISPLTTVNSTEQSNYGFYGSPDQPGFQIQVAIFQLVKQGYTLQQAATEVVNQVVENGAVISDALAFAAVSEQKILAIDFVHYIARLTSPMDAAKEAIQSYPDELNQIVTLGVTLYPQNAQEIVNAAALTGEISSDEAVLLAIAAGVDPTLIASSTAAGGNSGSNIPLFSVTPLGSGIGAGGTGGGDTTASTN